MLIGKQLNLDKARELALAGDLEGVMNEVKNIGVSQSYIEIFRIIYPAYLYQDAKIITKYKYNYDKNENENKNWNKHQQQNDNKMIRRALQLQGLATMIP